MTDNNREFGNIPYQYENLSIPGGGYVTGFTFSQKTPGILFCRTDIGGVYRFDYEKNQWKSFADSLDPDHLEMSFPTAIAIAEPEGDREMVEKEAKLLCMGGLWHRDQGLCGITPIATESWNTKPVPARIHGNMQGRGTGERLVLASASEWRDEMHPGTDPVMFFASQTEGILTSYDLGDHWEKVETCDFITSKNETNTIFVWCGSKDNSRTMVVACNGACNAPDEMHRGTCLYVSYDQGITFEALPVPEYPEDLEGYKGYVPHRYSFDGTWLYVTMNGTNHTGRGGMADYSAEACATVAGRIMRYRFVDNHLKAYEDITPDEKTFKEILPKSGGLFKKTTVKLDRTRYPMGFGGIGTCAQLPGLIVVSVTKGAFGNMILRSLDFGAHWSIILHDKVGELTYQAPYLKSDHNDGRLIIHWMTDVKINPFNPNEAWFNTGTGVFRCENVTMPRPVWKDESFGIEETVHINVYALPMKAKPGEPVSNDRLINVVDAVGDLGAFMFTDLDTLPENTIESEEHHRYITCMNADYTDQNPDIVYLSPRGNFAGSSQGGVVRSDNRNYTTTRLSDPTGLTERIDELLEAIAHPNRNSGFVAVGADGKTIIRGVADGQNLPINAIVRTEDEGASWSLCKVHQLPKQKNPRLNPAVFDEKMPQWLKDRENLMKVYADRVNPNLFFGFGEHLRVYISPDRGKNFYEYPVTDPVPDCNPGLIESPISPEIRGEAGKSGVFWIAAKKGGLWKMEYRDDAVSFSRITLLGERVDTIGLGIRRDGKDRTYLADDKTLYISGKLATKRLLPPPGEDEPDEAELALASGKELPGVSHPFTENELIYGFFRSEDYGRSWVKLNDANQNFGQIRSMDGDCRKFGRFYIATGTRGLLMGEEQE